VQPLGFAAITNRPLRILAVGAHSDDIEIGCGGTLLTLARSRSVEIVWAVASAEADRIQEATLSSTDFANGNDCRVEFGGLPESHLPGVWTETKAWVHSLCKSIEPDVVFTHVAHDLHQDHRVLAELVGNAFRDHLVLGYEIPKWDGDLLTPNTYSALPEGVAEQKAALLEKHFPSQVGRDWFDRRTFLGLMRIRGVECRAASGYAEGFHVRKAVLQL
jgi:LmbE family N-acetylglucosaminyl deacetylase